MKEDEQCRVLCRRAVSAVDFARFAYMIDGEYVINWLLDSLPAATKHTSQQTDDSTIITESWVDGFPLGYKLEGRYFINNHASFTIRYHDPEDGQRGYRVVGVDVEARSVSAIESAESVSANCEDSSASVPQEIDAKTSSILFTYDVTWLRSDVAWASRWDMYLKIKENKIHWFSIINSLLVVLLLTIVIALVLVRTLHKDIAKYNSVIMDEESSALDDVTDESGWKLIHGDVFRKPRHSKLLAVFVGSGIQILFMVLVSLALAAIGFFSPQNRGSYIQLMLLLFTFLGIASGYVSARIYKMFKGEDWKTTTLWAGLIVPGTGFGVFFLMNLLLWYAESSGAVPFSAMAIILILWLGISTPLVYIGAYRGYNRPSVELPVRVQHIPRQIPRQPWYAKTLISSMLGGILPFGAVSTELVFLMGSIWHHQFYYLFGFLFIVLLILIITCIEISIAMTYFQLSAEDYRWWWRSFLTSAFSGIYVFLYAVVYLSTKLHVIGFVGIAIYMGYMALAAFMFFLLTGSVGFLASLLFVRAIYGSIKID
jgi:transmembrane 9 superfamily protein 2/4